jgi:cell division protein ZapD
MQSTEIGSQSSLFPEVDIFTAYEQPLNERIRNCLRLEHLFASIQDGLRGGTEWHTRAAIGGMLDVSDLLSRADIKGELIKELERHMSKVSRLRDNPSVDPAALEDILATVGPLIAQLKSSDCHPGAVIRGDELINQVKQRIAIPGGTCNFDLPAFHHWLSKSPEERAARFEIWLSDLLIVDRTVAQVLKLLRESSVPQQVSVEDGLFQRQLDPAMQCQLIRLLLNDQIGIFPEISGGKHRFVVRFFRQPDTTGRPELARESISFELQCCGF